MVESVSYESFEFAGVSGLRRHWLQYKRERLLAKLTPVASVPNSERYTLLVLPQELCERFIRPLACLRFSELRTTIVTLHTGQRFLCSTENGIYLTDVEGFPDGIPFGIEDIQSFQRTEHFVTLATMRLRSEAIQKAGLTDAMVHGRLQPGNY